MRTTVQRTDHRGPGAAASRAPRAARLARERTRANHLAAHQAQERHFTASATVRDVVLGMADGLTVPFALAAGLAGAVESSTIVLTAGLAEIAAGAIAMGLGGYLAARGDAEHYDSERERERYEVAHRPEEEMAEVADVLREYGLTEEEAAPVVDALRKRPGHWVDFMMRFELGLEKPEPRRALTSAATIGGAYMVGGLIPLLPYLLAPSLQLGLIWSAVVTLAALLTFGYVKGHFTGAPPLRSAIPTAVVGSVAAAVAFTIARLVAH
jgi:VIT1/CCC1 family predicted Fe2+/Mn2+ transporter